MRGPRAVVSAGYHAASLIAVFAALAVGIAVGGLVLHGTVVSDLHRQVSQARSETDRTARAARADREEAAAAEQLLGRATAPLLAGRLTGVSVTVVSAPGTTDAVRRPLTGGLTAAGATIVGDIRLGAGWVDPTSEALIADLSARLVPAGLTLGTDARASLLTVLAAATVGPTPVGDRPRVLAALRTAQLTDLGTRADQSAGVVLVIGPGGTPGSAVASLSVQAAAAMTARGATTVVVTPGAAGTVLAGLRADAGLRARTTSVDRAELASAPLAVTAATAAAVKGNRGHYGGAGKTADTPPLG